MKNCSPRRNSTNKCFKIKLVNNVGALLNIYGKGEKRPWEGEELHNFYLSSCSLCSSFHGILSFFCCVNFLWICSIFITFWIRLERLFIGKYVKCFTRNDSIGRRKRKSRKQTSKLEFPRMSRRLIWQTNHTRLRQHHWWLSLLLNYELPVKHYSLFLNPNSWRERESVSQIPINDLSGNPQLLEKPGHKVKAHWSVGNFLLMLGKPLFI